MIKLLKEHKNFLFYCLLITFCSGIGQTYLLALFNDSFQAKLNLSLKEISYYYSFSTFVASLFLPFIGRLIDTAPFKKVVIFIGLALGFSVALLGQVETVWQLVLVYIIVRLLGQSSLPLTSAATISKHFGEYRGKALALASLGRSTAEGVLPLVVIMSMGEYGFSKTFLFLGALAWVFLIPTSFLLLKNIKFGKPFYPENEKAQEVRIQEVSFKHIYMDIKVYLLSLSNVLLPFVLTGIYFHNKPILEAKGWSLEVWAQSFLAYAVCMVVANFIAGYLVDKHGAHRIILLKFVPVLLGLVLLKTMTDPLVCYGALGLFGASVGLSTNAKSALLAELFGGTILATIKSIDTMMMVVSTSIAPILFSHLIEDFGVDHLLGILFFYTLATGFLLVFVLRSYKNSKR